VSRRSLLARAALAALAASAACGACEAADPTPERQQALVRIVRQDCGSCHGMRLTGGLGPALTREALADRPLESLVATTLHGRPGTPMPGWSSMLSEAEARWIARQLQAGFPDEAKAAAK
jgi:cytochrome c55X